MNFLIIAIGGFFGSISRYYLSVKQTKRSYSTWIANITGSILLGLLLKLQLNDMLSNLTWLLIGVGFCGAYTTFSTFGNETMLLILEKKYKRAAIYILSSITVSLLIVSLIIKLF